MSPHSKPMPEHEVRPSSGTLHRGQAGDWDRRLTDLVLFIAEHHRPPSEYSADRFERILTRWLNNQRSSLRNGVLLREKAAKLDH